MPAKMKYRIIALTLLVAVALSACGAPTPTPAPTPAPVDIAPASPKAVEYNLGETMIVQERFPADSRFRNMPVRLNGIIAAPTTGEGPFPVVILHGTHPGCPEIDHVDRRPAFDRASAELGQAHPDLRGGLSASPPPAGVR